MRKLRRIAIVLVLAACGSRTGLVVDDEGLTTDTPDGSKDGSGDGTVDNDADAGDPDALPGLDVQPNPDVVRTDCPDADATLIYVVGESNNLYSFFPTDGTFKLIGTLKCPASGGDTPFSMAVDRKGKAFVVFNPSGELFQVSTATAACARTSYQVGQSSLKTFGMGFSTDFLGPTETLYIAGDNTPSLLGTIDTTSFKLSIVGPFNPDIVRGELTGTGDGRLFSFYSKDLLPDVSFIGEIDKKSAKIVAETKLPTVALGQGWAFGFWGGDFYTFTAPSGTTEVNRYRPSDGTTTVVSTINEIIVGAGVSTCAPQQ
jgi:hypothetical protein